MSSTSYATFGFDVLGYNRGEQGNACELIGKIDASDSGFINASICKERNKRDMIIKR